ncbi:hypothetical protein [Mycobacteroides saopaulense]|uniref:RNA-binding protein n=1 Tax=Mycobacteroides saopaulense TaxID=1578165 RepID=A0A1X0JCY6_9MYCO|nr:hypothetical protein [Mycobacteroides saopaulense]OHT88593.1 hypothetical protein BKG68_01420 [Mycobacteroides saopaulense]OHU13412.1 hypothetical protein BKG73_01425 [Mycobacteroides saopaulense]ORB60345.1 hypothetical protein BST43_01970 [Mycobacteroides saopaulense]
MRRMTALATVAVAFAGLLPIAQPAANADVCVGGGRRISVSGCANIADTVQRYAPPPEDYAPLPDDPPPPPPPPNVHACVGYNGRWVSASGCNP